jgi:hypothetical protein
MVRARAIGVAVAVACAAGCGGPTSPVEQGGPLCDGSAAVVAALSADTPPPTSGLVAFDVVSEDPAHAYAPGSGVWVAPRSGSYRVTAQVQVALASAGDVAQLRFERQNAPKGAVAAGDWGVAVATPDGLWQVDVRLGEVVAVQAGDSLGIALNFSAKEPGRIVMKARDLSGVDGVAYDGASLRIEPAGEACP